MKIERAELVLGLQTFTGAGNGLIIGISGVGKSHLLAELVVQMTERNVPACLAKLDMLTDGSDADVANAFGMPDSNWIEKLKNVPAGPSRGIIVFDAFDTLKDEKLKGTVLRQIARGLNELPEWSVIVTVRNYDALHSEKLTELFSIGKEKAGGTYRQFPIPVLSDTELMLFLESNERLKGLYDVANLRLKEIFRIPFYLRLLNVILDKEPGSIETLSVARSEIELLDSYWRKVVSTVSLPLDMERTLRRLTKMMVAGRQLSVNKYNFLENIDASEVLLVDRLLSENVLAVQGVSKSLISFAHNLLFDYVVSRLMIPETGKEIIAFIKEDPTRPLFLRPSFIYAFTRLWYENRDVFWATYEALCKENDADIRIFNKLIPSAVVVREFESVEDIVWLEGGKLKERANQIGDILQGFEYLEVRASSNVQAALLKKLSFNLDIQFLGDFCVLLRKLLLREVVKQDRDSFEDCGTASRNLFDFCIARRKEKTLDWEKVLAIYAVPCVAKTYATNQDESRHRLRVILDSIGTADLNIQTISGLAEEIGSIYLHDSDFTDEIYRAVFGHEESEEVTPIYTSILSNYTSSRKDQFHVSQFSLKQFFPTFLKTFPHKGIALALELCNAYVQRRNQGGITPPDTISIPWEMNLNGIQAHYQIDNSYIWSDTAQTDDEIQMLQNVFDYFDELIISGEKESLDTALQVYLASAHAAIGWQLLLKWAGQHADIVHTQLFCLLVQPAILFNPDTVFQAGSFIENAVPFYTEEQVLQIEEAILSLPELIAEANRESVEHTVFKLLSRIPTARLKRQAAIALFAGKPPIANEELFTFTSSIGAYTPRAFLRDEGVDITDPLTDEILSAEQHLSSLNNVHRDSLPGTVLYEDTWKAAVDLYQIIIKNPQVPEQLARTALTSIAATCHLTLRGNLRAKLLNQLVTTDFGMLKEILLDCLSRHTSSDTHAEENYSPGGIFNSTPKSNAAGGLITLYILTNDTDLLPQIVQFSTDKNSITRFRVLQELGLLYERERKLFWEIVFERLENETDKFILGHVIGRVEHAEILKNEQPNLIRALTIAQRKVKEAQPDKNFLENFLLVTLRFYRITGHADAKNLLLQSIKDNPSITRMLVYCILKIIQPENHNRNLKDEADTQLSKRLVDLLLEVLNGCEVTLLAAAPEPSGEVKEAFYVVDDVVRRIYHSLQVNETLRGSNKRLVISDEDRHLFYLLIKPLLSRIMQTAEKMNFIQGFTAHHFIQILGTTLDFDAEYALYNTRRITEMTQASGYIYDRAAVEEMVKFTQKVLGNHRELLSDPQAFEHVKKLLEIYVDAKWPEALQLLWGLDEVFR